MPDNNQTIEYKQLLDNGEPFYPMVGKSSYSEWIGYEEVGSAQPEYGQWVGFVEVDGSAPSRDFVLPVANGGTGITDFGIVIASEAGSKSCSANTYNEMYTFTGLAPNGIYIVSAFIVQQFNSTSNTITVTFSKNDGNTTQNSVDYDISRSGWKRCPLMGIVQADANGEIEVGAKTAVAGNLYQTCYAIRVG